jgi:hypothetical protein
MDAEIIQDHGNLLHLRNVDIHQFGHVWANSRLVWPRVTLRGRQPRNGFHHDEMTGGVLGIFVVEACEVGWSPGQWPTALAQR